MRRPLGRRVVVTGMGCATPLGRDLGSTWAGAVEGRSGIAPFRNFDASKLPVRFGGEVWLDSNKGTFVPPHARGVGFVFQDARLLPFLTVAGNLHYAERRARGVGERVAFDEVVAAFGLESLLAARAPRSRVVSASA